MLLLLVTLQLLQLFEHLLAQFQVSLAISNRLEHLAQGLKKGERLMLHRPVDRSN